MAELTLDRPRATAAVASPRAPVHWHALFEERARAHPAATAFLQKRHGVWTAWTWAEASARVARRAQALRAAGLRVGESVGIVSGARIEAVLTVHACQRAGFRPVLLNPNLPSGGLASQCEQAAVVALVVEDQEQVDKVADVQSRLGALRRLWVIDPKGVTGYRHVQVETLDEAPSGEGGPGLPAASVAPATVTRAVPDELAAPAGADAVALFSSGVFTDPRLLSVPGERLVRLAEAMSPLAPLAGERWASLCGLSDPLGHWAALVAPVIAGVVACFGEGRLPTIAELREVAPAVVVAPSRVLERLRRDATARAARAGGLRGALLARWSRADGRPGPFLDALVGRPLANALGLGACRRLVAGADRLGDGASAFYDRLGIEVTGAYALAEAAGPVGWIDGRNGLLVPVAGVTMDVAVDGRLQLTCAGLVVDSGDMAERDGDRGVRLVGRAADLLTLVDGRQVSPSAIEAEMAASPFVEQAVAVGGPATGITALVELDEVAVRDWARARALPLTTLRSFAESPEVGTLVDAAVAEANRRLPPALRITRPLTLPRALDTSNGELTAALAVRRAMVRNRYAHRLVARPGNPS